MLWKIKKSVSKLLCRFFAAVCVVILFGCVSVAFVSGGAVRVISVMLAVMALIAIVVLILASYETEPEMDESSAVDPIPSVKVGIFLMLKKDLGKQNCLSLTWFYLAASVLMLWLTYAIGAGMSGSIVMAVLFFLMFFIGFGVMLCAYWEEEPEEFEKPALVADSVKSSDVGAESRKTEDTTNYWLQDQLIRYEMELEDAGKEVTPERKLRFLKKLFNEGGIDREDYKSEKNFVITVEVDDFLSEIDMQEYDGEIAYRRKMKYVKALFSDNLIDTEEYEEIKREIQESWEEDNL